MFRSALTGLCGALVAVLLTSTPAAAVRVGCPCKPEGAQRHYDRNARVAEAIYVRADARISRHTYRRPVRFNYAGHPRFDYSPAHLYPRRYRGYGYMAGGGEHRYNASSLAWRYWGY